MSVGSNVFGMFVAALAVVSSGMQQIYVGTMQAKHKLNANELLSNTAPAQVWIDGQSVNWTPSGT